MRRMPSVAPIAWPGSSVSARQATVPIPRPGVTSADELGLDSLATLFPSLKVPWGDVPSRAGLGLGV